MRTRRLQRVLLQICLRVAHLSRQNLCTANRQRRQTPLTVHPLMLQESQMPHLRKQNQKQGALRALLQRVQARCRLLHCQSKGSQVAIKAAQFMSVHSR